MPTINQFLAFAYDSEYESAYHLTQKRIETLESSKVEFLFDIMLQVLNKRSLIGARHITSV